MAIYARWVCGMPYGATGPLMDGGRWLRKAIELPNHPFPVSCTLLNTDCPDMGNYIVPWWFIVLLCLTALAGQAQPKVLYFNEPPKETLGRNKNQRLTYESQNGTLVKLYFIRPAAA